ncbi:MAG: glycosyltransferase family 2 protein [Aestuariivirga sp.]
MKISVISPVFSAASTISRAIESVLQQGTGNWEHIVVDGGSIDGTVEILAKYKHLNWISEPDQGQAHAMQKGFARSTGDIIVYLNADDYFLPGAFEAVLKEFEAGAEFVVGDVLVISERMQASRLNKPKVTLPEMLRHWIADAYCYNPVGYFYLRHVQEICPFNVANDTTMDLEFLLRAASKFKLTKIDQTLGCYVDGLSAKTSQIQSTPDYWRPANFPYIDEYITGWPEPKRLAFHREREKGYRRIARFWKRMERQRKLKAWLSEHFRFKSQSA